MNMGIINIKPCFCGSTEISVNKRAYNAGMDGYYNDWVFHCNKCGCDINYPADGFYGRDYYKTIEDAIVKWNKDHEKAFLPIGQDMDKIPDSVETYISDSMHKITKLVNETEDAFIFEHISSYVNGVMQHEGITKIPKRLLERALVCFKEEHREEWDVLMGIKEE